MAILEIPIIYDEKRFEIRTSLDDVEYIFYFYWVSRNERWNLDIKTSDGEDLLLGIVLNVDREILRQFTIDGLPTGKLVLFDTGLTHTECGEDDLGNRCKLIYITAE